LRHCGGARGHSPPERPTREIPIGYLPWSPPEQLELECRSGCSLPRKGQFQGQPGALTYPQPPIRLRAMPQTKISPPAETRDASLLDRVRAATDLLESI